MQVKIKLNLYIRAQGAEGAPPLGTVLGNLGVNTINFCKEFNQLTSDLPNYFKLSVNVVIYTNRSYTFTVDVPPLGYCIRLLSYVKALRLKKGKKRKFLVNCIKVKHVIQLCLWKFPHLPLRVSLPTVLGAVNSANLNIDF